MNANLYSLFERHFPDGAEQPFLVIPNGPVVHYDDLAAAVGADRARAGRRRLPARRPRRGAGRQALARASRCTSRACAPDSSTCRSTPATSARELGYFFGDAQPRVIVCNPDHLGVDRGARARDATVLTLDELRRLDRARESARRSPPSRARPTISRRSSTRRARRAAPRARC